MSAAATSATGSRVPFVDYLVLDPSPHLVANECTNCQARYFDRRVACASCEGREFVKRDVDTEGVLRAFTIVHHAAPGIPVPFVAATIDCGDTRVKGNIVNTPADPEHVTDGMAVRLTTVSVGVDAEGVEAVNYGFEPAEDGAS